MGEEPPEDTIIEHREELMVSPTGGNPTLRTAYFLKPSVTSITEPLFKPSSLSLFSKPNISGLKNKVLFKGRRNPQRDWKTWVDHLQPLYHSIWNKAGIHDAVMASTCQVVRHNDLIFGIAEKWCSETNTFVFPWGEATITLEDMMVLGGYSVLGDCVLSPLETKELIEIKDNLINAYREIARSIGQPVAYYAWMDYFMKSGSEFEHEAFLSLWLSRNVFPTNSYYTVGKNVFPIAIHLARGTPIALAPAVLASLYRDLSLLKETIVASTKLVTDEDKDDGLLPVTIWAPFQLVQLWAWERFPSLRPQPKSIILGEPRPARWHKLKSLKIKNVTLAIDSAGECFQWRPYATVVNNWMFNEFYREKEEWVSVDSDSDKELQSFCWCLRVCELVGLDCIEQYLPHRVAMQFGMDQDLPGVVARSNATPEIAWNNYCRPIRNAKLYVPPRLFESDVTTRYLEWWNNLVLTQQDAIDGVVRWGRSSKRSARLPRSSKRNEQDILVAVYPGSPPKCNRVEVVDFVKEHELTLSEMLRSTDKHYSFVNGLVNDGQLSSGTQSRSPSFSTAYSGMVRKRKRMKSIENIMQSEAYVFGSERALEDENESQAGCPINSTVSIEDYKGKGSSYCTLEIPGLELEARISNLEGVVAELKAARV